MLQCTMLVAYAYDRIYDRIYLRMLLHPKHKSPSVVQWGFIAPLCIAHRHHRDHSAFIATVISDDADLAASSLASNMAAVDRLDEA